MFAVDEPSEDYSPRPAPLFRPSRIVLAKGSNHTQSRRRLAERICAAYPEAEVVEAFGTRMPEYRRWYVPGGTFFFTLVTQRRRPMLGPDLARRCLREAVDKVRIDWPFE